MESVNKQYRFDVWFQPRLGPKPFTPPKLSLDNSSNASSELDRVFSVPVVPSSPAPAVNGSTNHTVTTPDLEQYSEVSLQEV